MTETLIGSTAAMLLCVFLTPRYTEWLIRRSYGQEIRKEGPIQHRSKAGTPTMGGIIILVSIAAPFLILFGGDHRALGVFVTMILMGAIGLLDDWKKISRKQNLGLSGKGKLAAMVVVSLVLWYLVVHVAKLPPTVKIRTLDLTITFNSYLYPIWIYLVLAFMSNAVNLTDGQDGLAAGVSAIVLTALIGIVYGIEGASDLTLLAACTAGACVGFLWYNAHPATIFMGDTGSLALGGLISALAIVTKLEEILFVIGGVFVAEAVSVMIQVFMFKNFRKRPFLMTPLHHHFEQIPWSETKIILRFWIAAIVCAAVGFVLYQEAPIWTP